MTIEEIQELIQAWTVKHGTHKSELTNMAILTEEVGELARVIALKHSEPSESAEKMKGAMANELADVLWALVDIANHSQINLTDALICSLEKRNKLTEKA